jgi:prepilin-type N-terminal cleavage/methylation domain-containing protein
MRSAGGFSLIETLVATTILAVGLTTLAHLYVVAVGANDRARETTRAALFARQKIEQLLAAPSLASSPPAALEGNVEGCFDLIDGRGRGVNGGEPAVFIRRWSVEPLQADPANTLVLQVRVLAARPGTADVRLMSLRPMGIS